jgi:hypothetical protein
MPVVVMMPEISRAKGGKGWPGAKGGNDGSGDEGVVSTSLVMRSVVGN